MKNFIEKFAIPFYQTKIENWEEKKQKLLDIYDRFAQDNMDEGEQNSDFEQDNKYHILIETILFDDIRKASKIWLSIKEHRESLMHGSKPMT